LSLLSDVAEDQPLVCLIDDMQWLDAASAEVLSFVAKRLGAESVVLIMATRVLDLEMSKLPTACPSRCALPRAA
jgi:predicted ATPase